MFRHAGLNYPKPGWTFDDFVSNGRKLTISKAGDEEPSQWGFNRPSLAWWQIWVWSNGGEIFSEDLSTLRLLEAPAIEALQWLADLGNVHRIVPSTSRSFEKQLSAMHHVSASVFRDYAAYPDLDYEV